MDPRKIQKAVLLLLLHLETLIESLLRIALFGWTNIGVSSSQFKFRGNLFPLVLVCIARPYLVVGQLPPVDTCSRFVRCNTGIAGFGDQLEHYVYCLHCAVLLRAQLLIESFSVGPDIHSSRGEYTDAAVLLGVNLSVSSEAAKLPTLFLPYADILEISRNGSAGLPLNCNTVVVTDLLSCPELHPPWCDFRPTYEALSHVRWLLRRNNSTSLCKASRLGFNRTGGSKTVNILLHIRNGDICLQCNSSRYVDNIARTIKLLAAKFRAVVSVESQHRVNFLNDADFGSASVTYNVNSSLVSFICRVLTADVLITDGSSLPVFVSAFGSPWQPVVFEELRKEVRSAGDRLDFPHHFYNEHNAILMEHGSPLSSIDQVIRILGDSGEAAVLRTRLFSSAAISITESAIWFIISHPQAIDELLSLDENLRFLNATWRPLIIFADKNTSGNVGFAFNREVFFIGELPATYYNFDLLSDSYGGPGQMKAHIIDDLLGFGLSVLCSDHDLVFFRDPLQIARRYLLHSKARLTVSRNCVLFHTYGLQLVNTGVLMFSQDEVSLAIAKEWRLRMTKNPRGWDQSEFNDVVQDYFAANGGVGILFADFDVIATWCTKLCAHESPYRYPRILHLIRDNSWELSHLAILHLAGVCAGHCKTQRRCEILHTFIENMTFCNFTFVNDTWET
jgi:Nucleotide-diphospho-sugar transferase